MILFIIIIIIIIITIIIIIIIIIICIYIYIYTHIINAITVIMIACSRGWWNASGILIEMFVGPTKRTGISQINIYMHMERARVHRFRDFKEYSFHSIPLRPHRYRRVGTHSGAVYSKTKALSIGCWGVRGYARLRGRLRPRDHEALGPLLRPQEAGPGRLKRGRARLGGWGCQARGERGMCERKRGRLGKKRM